MNPPTVISFFYDQPSLTDPEVNPEDLNAALIGGVDLGLSSALVELAEGKVEAHRRLAVQAFHIVSEEVGEFHVERAQFWADLRDEALAAHRHIARVRAN